jgi:hypothetical protein
MGRKARQAAAFSFFQNNFTERRYIDGMHDFSGQKSSGMEIPDYAIERIARCLMPMIREYYESAEGQAALAAWNKKEDAEDTRQEDTKTI